MSNNKSEEPDMKRRRTNDSSISNISDLPDLMLGKHFNQAINTFICNSSINTIVSYLKRIYYLATNTNKYISSEEI